MAKKKVSKVTKYQGNKVTGFSLKLLLSVVLLLLSVLLFDLVEGFLSGRKNPVTDWSKIPVEQQIDAEIKNAQEAVKYDVKDFDDATLGK